MTNDHNVITVSGLLVAKRIRAKNPHIKKQIEIKSNNFDVRDVLLLKKIKALKKRLTAIPGTSA